MAGACLIRCVLIQVLLITVYGESTKIEIKCSNHTGTVEKELQLECNVTCNGCEIKDYKWSKVNKPEFNNCSNGEKHDITSGKNQIFQCRIPSASVKHNGTFKFWVQSNKGQNGTIFHVTIVPNAPAPTKPFAAPTTPVAAPTTPVAALSDGPQEKNIQETKKNEAKENDHSYNVAVAVAVISCLVIVTMAGVLLRKKNDNIRPISTLFTHKHSVGTEIV